MLGHGQFAIGVRVAFATAHLARVLHVSERTVSRTIYKLEQWPELVRILRVERGERAWDGRPSFVSHIEWELGPALSAVAQGLFSSSVDTVPLTPRHGAPVPPDTVPPDPSGPLMDQLKRSPEPPRETALNLKEISNSPAPDPSLRTTEPQPDNPSRPTPHLAEPSSAPVVAPCPPLSDAADRAPATDVIHQHQALAEGESAAVVAAPNPPLSDAADRALAADVIRQHRALAEGKSAAVPISEDELALVGAALEHLDGCRDARDKLELCARISALAARDAAANGHPRASLRFTFGGLPDEPSKFFLARAARLREERAQAEKERCSAELTAVLFGLRPPAKVPPDRRPPRAAVRAHVVERPPKTRNSPLSPSELLARIEAFTSGRSTTTHAARAG